MKPTQWIATGVGVLLLAGMGWSWYTFRDAGARRLYTTHCAACHGDRGQGIRKLIPPLAGSDYMAAHWGEMPCLVRHGLKGKITVNGIEYEGVMLPVSSALKPQEMVSLFNYLGSNWGNDLPRWSFRQVDSSLTACP